MINSRLIIPYLLFLLLALYFLQGSIYPSGSVVSQAILLFIILISGIYFLKTLRIKTRPPGFLIAWTLLLVLNAIGFLLTGDFSNFYHVQMFKNILGAMLPLYPFYYFSRFYYLSDKELIRFFFIMTPVAILSFMTNNAQLLSSGNSGISDVVNNLAYVFVNLIPFVFLFRQRRLLSALLILILMIFIIQGAKRGAIFAGAIGLVMYFILQVKTVESHKRIKEYTVILLITLVLAFLTYKAFINNAFAVDRITGFTEGNFSRRDVIYKEIFLKWYNSEKLQNLVFGYGFAGSLRLTGGAYAHNDWLELLSSFGIIGIAIYVVLFNSAIKEIKNDQRETNESILMITIVILWGFTSLVSMWYTSLGVYNQAMLLGYLIGKREQIPITEYEDSFRN